MKAKKNIASYDNKKRKFRTRLSEILCGYKLILRREREYQKNGLSHPISKRLVERYTGTWLREYLPEAALTKERVNYARVEDMVDSTQNDRKETFTYRVDSEEERKRGIFDRYNEVSTIDSTHKKISVVVPCYNHSHFIEERINSILNQDYPIDELIFLDDCSSDDSVEIAKRALKDAPFGVKFVVNKTNSGSTFSQWERGLMEASSEYVWIAESDDSSSKEFLSTTMKAFNDDKVIISMTESELISENGEVVHNLAPEVLNLFNDAHWDKSYINDGKNEISDYLSSRNYIPNVSAVVWKNCEAVRKAICGAHNYSLVGDWYAYVKTLEHGDIAFSNKRLNKYRCHSNTVRENTKKITEFIETMRIQDIVRKEHHLSQMQLLRQKKRLNAFFGLS